MKKIVFLVRSTKAFGTQRRDHDYIIENLIKIGCHVDIYDPKQKLLMNVNDRTITDYNIFPKWLYFSKTYILLNFLILYRFLLKNKNKYDIVQISYVREEYLIFPSIIKNVGKKLFLTLFGSDINKRTFIKKRFTKIYNLADLIIVTNKDFGNKAVNLIGKGRTEKKLKVLMLPQDHFDLYRDKEITYKESCKRKLGFDLNKTIVIVGTNSNELEQHELIISALKSIPDPFNYIFVFPLSNRFLEINDREIMLTKLIKEELYNFNLKIYTLFLSYEDMRDLRFASDIFINLRLNDQLAVSMLESNLSYTDIITGSWLPYHDYLSSVESHLINNIADIPTILLQINIEDKQNKLVRLRNNKEVVINKYDNKELMKWMDMYK